MVEYPHQCPCWPSSTPHLLDLLCWHQCHCFHKGPAAQAFPCHVFSPVPPALSRPQDTRSCAQAELSSGYLPGLRPGPAPRCPLFSVLTFLLWPWPLTPTNATTVVTAQSFLPKHWCVLGGGGALGFSSPSPGWPTSVCFCFQFFLNNGSTDIFENKAMSPLTRCIFWG